MIQLVYSPVWFFGKDIIIDIVSVFVLGLVAFTSLRFYRMNKENKKYLYTGISFILLALAFAFKILTNFTIYYIAPHTRQVGYVTLTYEAIHSSDILFYIGFLAFRLLTLFGFYMLYSIYQENQSKSTIFIVSFLIIVSTFLGEQAYYLFHVTALIILIFITWQYFKNYKENKHYTTKLLAISFLVIALSHLLSMFIDFSAIFYVIAELIQFVGYMMLLVTFIKVISVGKKKRKN